MNRGNFFRRTLLTLLTVSIMLFATVVGAKIQMYTATGEDYPSVAESQDISKQRALYKAIKKATKQAGVYLKTYSRSVNSELTDDEVTAITSNAWQLVGEPKFTREIINHSDDTQIIVWKATVEVNVDDSEIQSWIKRDDKEKSTIITQTREALKSSEENDRQIEDLREKYNRATTQAEKDKIREQMNDADRDFLANQKNEEGLKIHYAKDYNGAIKLYNEAIELKPDWSWPYNNRGNAYEDLKQYERAIQDYDKAIEINPNYLMAYNNRGNAYSDLGQNERAIQDYDKAIQLNPNYFEAYTDRGATYYKLGQNERAIQDYDKAIQINPNYDMAYYNRGTAYALLRKFKQAIQDFNKAIELNPNYAAAYNNRAYCYQELGDKAKAQADFAKAKELGYNG
ncbi:MAG: tetratricopeptide repeat protein [Selenomonadaceae bacterium]|nr:tetratricopeptide repeat protein [Selenomonadaceae bacterium]